MKQKSDSSQNENSNRGQTINWQDIHRRMDTLREAIDQDWTPDPERTQQILQSRARALAEPLETSAIGQQLEIIEFLLAEQRYGITSAYVREVCPLTELTPVPCTPAYVLGIIDVRGEFISVIDIKKFFDLAEQGLSDLNKVIVLHSPGMTFGILADTIVDVRNIAYTDLQKPLSTSSAIHSDYFLGVTAEHMAVIDASKLLADQTLVVNEEVAL